MWECIAMAARKFFPGNLFFFAQHLVLYPLSLVIKIGHSERIIAHDEADP